MNKVTLLPPYRSLLGFQVMVLVIYIIILLALCLAPLSFNCPCIMDRHNLKPRPDVIGRRGAPMVSWCFARPRCLSQLIAQMDDVQLICNSTYAHMSGVHLLHDKKRGKNGLRFD